MMAMTCAFFRSCVTCLDAPDQLISYLNNNLCKVNRESFVTAIYAIYDPQSRILKMARAGNPLPILYRPSEKKAVELSCEGVLIMGLYPYSEVPVSEMALQPGDRVLFYTDGITERFNSKRETYGVNRLLHQFESTDADSPAGILDGIIEDLSRFAELRPADDDMAMLMMVVE
jgi:sigma-B regulation protein RsbU (phosphoserine phosphatase)